MSNIDKVRVNNTDYDIVSGDNLPVGTEIDYDGNTVPTGWQEVDDPSVYSTTEQRVGTWIDGKPLYRKTYTITTNHTGSNNGTREGTNHNISNIDKIFINTGKSYFTFDSDGISYPLGRSYIGSNTIAFTASAVVDSSKIYTEIFFTGSCTCVFTITVEYTKTTD